MKKIKLLLVAVLLIGCLFSLSSCGNSEASEVKALVLEYFEHNKIDYSNGYPFEYEVVYNIEGKDGSKYYKNLPTKFYRVTTLGCSNQIMYKGMYDKKNETN